MFSEPRRDLVCDLLAPPLILATPSASFVKHKDDSYAAADFELFRSRGVLDSPIAESLAIAEERVEANQLPRGFDYVRYVLQARAEVVRVVDILACGRRLSWLARRCAGSASR